MKDNTVKFDDMITEHDLTMIFGITRMTVWRWRRFYELETCKIRIPGTGSKPPIRFSLHEVTEWARRGRRQMPGLTYWKKLRRLQQEE